MFRVRDPGVLTSQTLETPGRLPGISEMLSLEWRGWKTQCPRPGTPGCQHAAGWPRPGAAHGSTDLQLGLERRAGAPCGQDRLRHCPPTARPRVIVTLDLARQPIGRAWVAGRVQAGRGRAPRPLTKYRNRRGGLRRGPRPRSRGRPPPPQVSASIFTPPTAGTFLMGRGG